MLKQQQQPNETQDQQFKDESELQKVLTIQSIRPFNDSI